MRQVPCHPRPGVKGWQQIQIIDDNYSRVVNEDQEITFRGSYLECQNYLAAIGLRLLWEEQKQ